MIASGCIQPRYAEQSLSLEAACTADVTGVGTLEVESDYLPAVINCENGAASFEALKAQAVAARSYLYYRLETSGEISDGTGDQVYSCGRAPTTEHLRAVAETSGEVLRYSGVQVAAFYVAGALQSPPDCLGGTDDPTDTEQWVTNNDGRSAAEITQTMLGFVDPGNNANRGCMSQNGSDCLAEMGRDYDSILRFYYGADIEIERAIGPCVVGGDAGPEMPGGQDSQDSKGCGCQSGGSPAGGGFLAASLLLLGLRRRS